MYYALVPAYGRDYKTAKEVTDAFNQDMDFEGDIQLDCRLVNKSQLQEIAKGPVSVQLRYAKLRKLTVVKVQ